MSGTSWIYFDVDDTLVMWGLDQDPQYQDKLVLISDSNSKAAYPLVPHEGNIAMLRDYWNVGWTVIVWSAGGKDWADAVTDALGLREYVHHTLSKPLVYVDDLDCTEFMYLKRYEEFK